MTRPHTYPVQKAGIAPPSYVHSVLSADDYTANQEYDVKISAASAYVGAVDTVRDSVSPSDLVISAHVVSARPVLRFMAFS